jgi:hypothetical protein
MRGEREREKGGIQQRVKREDKEEENIINLFGL